LEADPERLRTLLENLFRNAVEHGGETVAVTVETTDTGFAVADDGAGFDDPPGQELFDYGHTTADGGTGFGLSIVRDVAEAHDWRVRAESSAAGGARFVIETGER